ncbi:hypothetical protein [Wolbachia endosymbiont of Ctenocephalides felis wCfeJ]|uniref:hypothetical protein n=1 Tax=Wolbachia endosymbiont of Ctenocephalides felis wCfeJ TaxID=2732594 RepID=UPI001445C8C7|nr:hypothetical protein [Wolbachia endosymbiont of Ctenocephalides felis wCfeJ]WCR58585.1 MAG: hypothetical protein PG980_001057 [Wolbachia endosymbiont of Ctenocephalides felis wCfeJ]
MTTKLIENGENIVRAIQYVWNLYNYLSHSQGSNDINSIKEFKDKRIKDFALSKLIGLKDSIDKMEKENSNIKNLTITKVILSFAEKSCEDLKKLKECSERYDVIPNTTGYEEFYSQLSKVVTDYKLRILADKIRFLILLKRKNDFATVKGGYEDKWCFYDMMNDEDFKQRCISAAEEEDKSFSESFKKSMGGYIKLVEEGREIASKYFGKASFQAYCEETGNADKTLNINLINYSDSEPIKISDILQQEESIDKLNIYCNKRHDICAHRKDQKRYYEFKEGAWYQMISEWPIKDKSGRGISRCTMVMNVGSDGIAEIVEFIGKGSNGENHILSLEQDMELIKQNKELYIQDVLLCNAVEEFLRMQRSRDNSSPGAVPQNTDSNGVSEVCGEQLRPSHVVNVGGTANSGISEVCGEQLQPSHVVNVGGTANSKVSGVHKEQSNLGENNENMGHDTGNQPRHRIHLVFEIPPTDQKPLSVEIGNNSKIEKNLGADNIKIKVLIECAKGLEGVVVEGDSHSFPIPTTPTTSNKDHSLGS